MPIQTLFHALVLLFALWATGAPASGAEGREPFGVESLHPFPDTPRRTEEQLRRMPNVLFIAVDDWNDWVGCLGHDQAKTPHVDRLAAGGLVFTNAHCVASVCNPSRVAVMTGLRPETTGVYENNHVLREKAPDVVTLSQHFMEHGYQVVGAGKIYHDNPAMFDRASWNSYYHWHPSPYRTGGAVASPYSSEPDPEPPGRPTRGITPLTKRNFDWAALDRPESDWPDAKVARWASGFLSRPHDRPFFLAVGIFRPHVPWFNPRKYVDLYPLEELALPLVKKDDLADLGPWARKRALDRHSRHEKIVALREWKPAVQAYLASISFADANVGRVLDALERGPHRGNTIVVFWSDHGYHLGEKHHWHKRTLWERSTRVPLIVAAPGVTSAGSTCGKPVSLLDIYPTLVELCGLDGRSGLEGRSLVPLLRNPETTWNRPCLTTWKSGNCSVRTERWRYIRYATGEEELYDHREDPHEWHNLATAPNLRAVKRRLAGHLPPLGQGAARDAKDAPTRALPDSGSRSRRPNVLLIVSEDNGPELGCYGDPYVRTPRLDQLAAEGARFANAYVTHAVCSASRGSFLTGLYPFQNGQIGLATHRYAMFRHWDNLPGILKQHGYRTGLIGKLHVNPEEAFPFDFRWNEKKANSFGSRDVHRVARVAGEFIRRSPQPFFLSVNFADAHFPLLKQQGGLPREPLTGDDVLPLPFIGADSPRLRQGTADYYNCLMRLDTGIGLLLDELGQAGKSDTTLVFYLGDHGAQFSRGKATCYEGGLRIPLLFRWPERVPSGIVREELVSTIDILPTVLEAVGLQPKSSLPGRSLLPLIVGSGSPWRQYLFAERTAYHSGSFFPQRTIRDKKYKLILNLTRARPNPVSDTYLEQQGAFFIYGTNREEISASAEHVQRAYATWGKPPRIELYDLEEDRWEFRNLAARPELAEVKARLLEELQDFRVEHGDPLLDAKKLKQLAAEHDHVAENVPGGRYGPGQEWQYLQYLQNKKPPLQRE